ncbi:hypothetical protein PHYSODRAFT_247088 [Phytophthora sojae]|uniref:Uncharacterized protein n=1 Tax=Phytophthora sojae (strain P6497) TaxID=1094619 RepID=G4YM08_PHYSP|nr:hypothetical protein PHYSODRAFT_247088 [Phytophthora sojae]EGZ27538.1 hypothetical protein PHYSODRAFT_247088 [Phytophthora sojae]|eukprot:XP_009514813.1 hypothetical protein PHYSODRAFT_247088 [Phytophthora sojae]
MPLPPNSMALTSTNSPPITNSMPSTPQAVPQALKRHATSADVLSQTAQRHRRIDAAIDKASCQMTMDNSSEFSSTIVAMMFMVQERQAARNAEYQRQKEERQREQAEREEKQAAEREMRDQQSLQLKLMLMAKLMGDQNNN